MKPVSCFYTIVCKNPNTLKFDSEIWFMITDIVTIGSLANKPKNRRKTTLTEENVNMIGNLMQSPRATVPNVGATAHRWVIESSRGAVVDQNEFGGR